MSFLAKGLHQEGAVNKSRKILLIIIGVCVLGAVGVYWFFSQSQTVSIQDQETQSKKEIPLKRVNWKKTLYEDQTFQSLKNPLSVPLDSGVTGNTYPFGEKIKK